MNLTNFDQLLNSSYWQFLVHGKGAIEQNQPRSQGPSSYPSLRETLGTRLRANETYLSALQLSNLKVSIKDGNDWKTFSVYLKPGQRLIKKKREIGGS